jgi:hypothetical protein
MSFLSLLWVSFGAPAVGAVAAALSTGDEFELGPAAVCDPSGALAGGEEESAEAGADDCDCALSCAIAGTNGLALSSTAITTAQAGDFMGNSSA